MDTIYNTIYEFLNVLFPDNVIADFGDINRVIAYLATLGVIYLFILKPIFKLFGGAKR